MADSSTDPNDIWERIMDSQAFLEVPTIKGEESNWTSQGCCTRIVCMSDTHGHHREIIPPRGDILLHAGDLTSTGEIDALQDTVKYFEELDFPTTVWIAGNHDVTMDFPYYQHDINWKRFHERPVNAQKVLEKWESMTKASDNKFFYLQDESCSIPISRPKCASTISIYGSPWTPRFYDWAFNVSRGGQSREKWSQIPDETDVLITHGPPLGRGDLAGKGRQTKRAGCFDLLEEVQQRVKPRLQVFGHIHEGYGVSFDGSTLYVNASNLTHGYASVQPCVVVDLPHDINQPARVVRPYCSLNREQTMEWFREQGYTNLVESLERAQCTPQDIPSGETMVRDTARAYADTKGKLKCKSISSLKVAQEELRRALSQLYAESFG